jgi:hypothetical protein
MGIGPMPQLVRHFRIRNLVASRLWRAKFEIRSPERDRATDRSRIESILSAIDCALKAAESERVGLKTRIEEVLARASVSIGTATDEYLDREFYRSHHQDLFDFELARGEKRTRELSTMIGHLEFVRAVMLSKFPIYQEPLIDRH